MHGSVMRVVSVDAGESLVPACWLPHLQTLWGSDLRGAADSFNLCGAVVTSRSVVVCSER